MSDRIHTLHILILVLIFQCATLLIKAAEYIPAASDSLNCRTRQIVAMLDKADYANALPALNSLIRDARKEDSRQLELSGRAMLGQVLVVAGEPEAGYRELTSALEECMMPDEKLYNTNEIKVLAYNGLAIYFFAVRGDYYLGKEYFLKASDIASKSADERLARRFETNLIQAAVMERDTTFLHSSQKLYDWAVKNNDPYTRYVSACQLAQLYCFTGRHAEATALLEDAERTGKANNVGDWVPFYLSKADIAEYKKDYEETEQILDKAYTSLGTGNEAVYYRSVIGSRKTGLFLTKGDYKKALECGLEALATGMKLNQKTHIGRLMSQISYAYERLGDKDNALKYARMYENFKDSTYNREKELMIRSMATLYNVEKKEREAEYTKQLLTQERERNTFLIVSIILFAIAATITFLAYLNKSRLHKKLVSLYQELTNKEKESLKQLERLQQVDREIQKTENGTCIEEDTEDTPEEDSESNGTFDRIWTDLMILMENTKDWSDTDTNREAIAAKLNTNRTYLSKAVKVHTEMTFTQFINSRRISRAIEILSDPVNKDYPLKVLSQELGFKSLNAFYTNFKAATGISPGSFRKSV